MGGLGSGRYYREKRQTTIELSSVDIRDIDYLSLPPDLWIRGPQQNHGDSIYINAGDNELLFGIRQGNSVRVIGNAALTWSPRNFGGAQPYFLCPEHDCGRRVAILYLSGKQIACRTCSNLSYESQHESKYLRSFRRTKKLRQQIGADTQPLTPLPERPRYMHQASYDQITYMVLATDLKAFHEMKAYLHDNWFSKLHHLDHLLEELL